MRHRYRIIQNVSGDFEIEVRRWWFPFWLVHRAPDGKPHIYYYAEAARHRAQYMAEKHANRRPVVADLGKLP